MRGKNLKWIFIGLLIMSYLAYCVTWLYPAFYRQGIQPDMGTGIPVNELPAQLRQSLTWTGTVRTAAEILMPLFVVMSALWIWLYGKRRTFVSFLLALLASCGILIGCFLLIALIERIFFPDLKVYADLWLPFFYMFIRFAPYIVVSGICFGLFWLLRRTSGEKQP